MHSTHLVQRYRLWKCHVKVIAGLTAKKLNYNRLFLGSSREIIPQKQFAGFCSFAKNVLHSFPHFMYERWQNAIFVLGRLNTNLFQNGKYVNQSDTSPNFKFVSLNLSLTNRHHSLLALGWLFPCVVTSFPVSLSK